MLLVGDRADYPMVARHSEGNMLPVTASGHLGNPRTILIPLTELHTSNRTTQTIAQLSSVRGRGTMIGGSVLVPTALLT